MKIRVLQERGGGLKPPNPNILLAAKQVVIAVDLTPHTDTSLFGGLVAA